MMIRWIGAFCILAGSGSMGLIHNMQHRRDVRILEQLIEAIRYMEQDLRYRHLPLPELLRNALRQSDSTVKKILLSFSDALESQVSEDADMCMRTVLSDYHSISFEVHDAFTQFAKCLGQFDITGQLVEFANLREELSGKLLSLTTDQATRMRSYQTLALCAGAAVAILLI